MQPWRGASAGRRAAQHTLLSLVSNALCRVWFLLGVGDAEEELARCEQLLHKAELSAFFCLCFAACARILPSYCTGLAPLASLSVTPPTCPPVLPFLP